MQRFSCCTVATPYSMIPYNPKFCITWWSHGLPKFTKADQDLCCIISYLNKTNFCVIQWFIVVPSIVNGPTWWPLAASVSNQGGPITPYFHTLWHHGFLRWSPVHLRCIHKGLKASCSTNWNTWSNHLEHHLLDLMGEPPAEIGSWLY